MCSSCLVAERADSVAYADGRTISDSRNQFWMMVEVEPKTMTMILNTQIDESDVTFSSYLVPYPKW